MGQLCNCEKVKGIDYVIETTCSGPGTEFYKVKEGITLKQYTHLFLYSAKYSEILLPAEYVRWMTSIGQKCYGIKTHEKGEILIGAKSTREAIGIFERRYKKTVWYSAGLYA